MDGSSEQVWWLQLGRRGGWVQSYRLRRGKERRSCNKGGCPRPMLLLLVDFFFFSLSRASTNNLKDKRKAINNADRSKLFPWSLLALQYRTAHLIKSGCMVRYVEPIHRSQFRFPTNLSCAFCLSAGMLAFLPRGGRLAAGDPSPTRTFFPRSCLPFCTKEHQGPLLPAGRLLYKTRQHSSTVIYTLPQPSRICKQKNNSG